MSTVERLSDVFGEDYPESNFDKDLSPSQNSEIFNRLHDFWKVLENNKETDETVLRHFEIIKQILPAKIDDVIDYFFHFFNVRIEDKTINDFATQRFRRLFNSLK